MTHITTCTACGKAYEEHSEEEANATTRLCPRCWRAAGGTTRHTVHLTREAHQVLDTMEGSLSEKVNTCIIDYGERLRCGNSTCAETSRQNHEDIGEKS